MPLDWARQATAIDNVTWQVSWADCRESKKKTPGGTWRSWTLEEFKAFQNFGAGDLGAW